jgi:DinB superfamily
MDAAAEREALRAHYEAVREPLLRALEGLTDEQMLEPSLDGWSVKDHLAHLTVWDEIRVQEIERISAGGEPAWPPTMTGPQIETFNNLIADLRRGLSPAQVWRELDTARARVLAAIGAASERGLDGSHYGEAGLRSSRYRDHTDDILRWRKARGL